MGFIQTENCRVDTIDAFASAGIRADVLRIDLIHPLISGNKWFKLKEYLNEAQSQQKKTIVTFGGAWSNHIVATAAAAQALGFKSKGIIRGERPATPSLALQQALDLGMELHFIAREAYRKKSWPGFFHEPDHYLINEGGYGIPGARGAAGILSLVAVSTYTHVLAAVGTGTMLAGLTSAVRGGQQALGISVMKNNWQLEAQVRQLLPENAQNHFQILHDFHFGGYAKSKPELFAFMNRWYEQTSIPSDFVYTGKLFYAVNELVSKNFFPEGSQLLVIHSGGLQGNRPLPKGTLIF